MREKNKTVLTEARIKKILKQHAELLKKCSVKRIGLFGSFVRKTQKKRSDVDFLLSLWSQPLITSWNLLFPWKSCSGKKLTLSPMAA